MNAAPGDITTELAARLRLTVARTARRLRQEAGSDLGPAQASALATIETHGPLAPSELAHRERIKRPTATRIVGSLERLGLIERVADPSDGRCSILSASAEGRALLRRLRARKTAYLAQRLRDLDPDDLAALERAAEVLERMLEQDPTAEQSARRGGRA
ncbi:MAG: MarR family transcriptional regulator [Actinobacteria bacterium]|nr:MarR family transcriptional regulator [Actinomycetota bacterium]